MGIPFLIGLYVSFRRFVSNRLATRRQYIDLWLDDLRPAPKGWYWATTAEEAFDILKNHLVFRASFDHDLGQKLTGYDLIKKLVQCREEYKLNFWPTQRPTIHSANPVGRSNMAQLIDRWGPYNGNG